jgi:lon-related putative ATP-dependent protease
VHNFDQPHMPQALKLEPGKGRELRDAMLQFVEDLRAAIASALESDQYRARHLEIEEWFNHEQEKALTDLRSRATPAGVAILQGPGGIALAAQVNGAPLDPAAFSRLPAEEQQRLRQAINQIEGEVDQVLHQLPNWRREVQRRLRDLKRTVTRTTVESLLDELRKRYAGLDNLQKYFDAVEADVVENVEEFRHAKDGEDGSFLGIPLLQWGGMRPWFRRYQVNVLNDGSTAAGAPVIYENNPTYHNLIGRTEHVAHMGALVTDFTLIKPGALHRANGGYLILDARRVLAEPFAWESLKRALRAQEIRIESLAQSYSLISTMSLEPQPIPLSVKVVLLGDRILYYLLHELDPDFPELFKVAVDFEETITWDTEHAQLYARLLGMIARNHNLCPLDRAGVSRVIERSARVAGDGEKLSVGLRGVTDLLRESDYWARKAGRSVITAADVQHAIDAEIHREDRLRERTQEEIARRTVLISCEGTAVGQINGLSVIQLGRFAFGHPSRITARVRLGNGHVVDIERAVELGGPIHSKGVMILAGFLSGRYIPDQPLCLSASLGFEQSYGMVEGDSASAAELCVLLSALAVVPVKQAIAITGSVNQHGEIQAIGGVNEKIEGFFDICRARGLRGDQGVIIPTANVKHLMLNDRVVDAVAAGQFHIHAVDTIDEAMEILTGLPAGQRDDQGLFPAGSVNQLAEQRLTDFARRARAFRAIAPKDESEP